jgi:hypothetical protein
MNLKLASLSILLLLLFCVQVSDVEGRTVATGRCSHSGDIICYEAFLDDEGVLTLDYLASRDIFITEVKVTSNGFSESDCNANRIINEEFSNGERFEIELDCGSKYEDGQRLNADINVTYNLVGSQLQKVNTGAIRNIAVGGYYSSYGQDTYFRYDKFFMKGAFQFLLVGLLMVALFAIKYYRIAKSSKRPALKPGFFNTGVTLFISFINLVLIFSILVGWEDLYYDLMIFAAIFLLAYNYLIFSAISNAFKEKKLRRYFAPNKFVNILFPALVGLNVVFGLLIITNNFQNFLFGIVAMFLSLSIFFLVPAYFITVTAIYYLRKN